MAYNIHDLRVSGMDLISIESCVIEANLGEHTSLYLTAYIKNEKFLIYNKFDRHPIQIHLEQNKNIQLIFNGIITQVTMSYSSGIYKIELVAKSYSYLLDIHKRSRSFQDISIKYSTLINKILVGYEGAKSLVHINDKVIGELIVQYEETDWEFLKRILSQLEVSITPAAEYQGIYVYIGVPEFNNYDIPYKLLNMRKDLHSYYYLKANQQEVNDIDFMKYQIDTDEIRGIFEVVHVEGQNLTIRSFVYQFLKSEMRAVYQLQRSGGLKRKIRYPMHMIGTALLGTVIGVQKDEVQVHLEIDEVSNKNRSYWFPYSTISASPDGSGWYCMPEKGDTVRVYFPSKYTAQAIALSAVSKYKVPKVGTDKMQNPKTLYLSTKHNKAVILSNDGVKIACDGDTASIFIGYDGKINVNAKDTILVEATRNIEMKAINEYALHAKEFITMQCDKGGALGLTLEGKAAIQGTEVKVD